MEVTQHPWKRTLREHLEWIRSNYGEDVAKGVARLANLRGIEPEEVLELDPLRSLLLRAGVPPVDLGLDPYPEEEN